MPSFGPATRKLKGKLGRRVTTDHDAVFAASFDGSKLSFLPEAVVRPKTKADIAEVLALANKYKVPVTARGAGSSLTGSGSPIAGGWVLDLSGWNKITVDAEAGFAQVQAGRPVILLELAGTASEVADTKETVLAWAKANTTAFREARDRVEAEELWDVRRKCSGAMFALGDSKLNEDIVVPMRSYEKFALFLDKLRKSSRLPIPTFGHLADGNLHVNIMYHRENHGEYLRAEKAVGQLMAGVVKLGGAISGEHGIGLAKTPFLALQHSPAQIKAMRAVKEALDPNGILNPGKMFTLFKVWEHPRLKIALPWDHK